MEQPQKHFRQDNCKKKKVVFEIDKSGSSLRMLWKKIELGAREAKHCDIN